jgi:hypothetical protein
VVECAYLLGRARAAVECIRSTGPLAREGWDAVESRKRGGSAGALSNDEKAKAKTFYGNRLAARDTPNAAVCKTLKEINNGRKKKVSKTTIERAVGVRHK